MCGRFAVTLPPDAMAQLFDAAPANDLADVPNFNVCPTVPINVCSLGEGGRRLSAMRWGFVPHWYKTPTDGPLLINARAETIAEKPAFRAAARERRCLIAMDGFYEWDRAGDKKLPWYIHRADRAPMVVAGIWQTWERGDDRLTTCAIVTTEASGKMAEIHNRIPVLLEPETWGLWLGENGKGAARLMTPAPDETYEMYRVGTEVNSNRASGAGLLDPITD
jgi:putative SOS response-associated peptidase YedK